MAIAEKRIPTPAPAAYGINRSNGTFWSDRPPRPSVLLGRTETGFNETILYAKPADPEAEMGA